MSEALDVVEKLNTELSKMYDEDGTIGFSYASNGFQEVIQFCDIIIWDSDSEEREWLKLHSEYEVLETFIRKQVKSLTNRLVNVAGKLGGGL